MLLSNRDGKFGKLGLERCRKMFPGKNVKRCDGRVGATAL